MLHNGAKNLVAPNASMEDGLLDIAVYPGFSKAELLNYFVKSAHEGVTSDGRIQRYRAQKIEEGGQLTELVRRRPYSVVLFDEIEKAYPDVFNVLPQLLDDGRLTDGQGRTVDFRNTLVIMTSNLGSELWLGAKVEKITPDTITHGLQEHFRHEFLNRIDEIIIIHSLSRADLFQVVEIQLRYISALLEERAIASSSARRHALTWPRLATMAIMVRVL